MEPSICVVVPTIRAEKMAEFKQAWESLFRKYQVMLITIWDGKEPKLEYFQYKDPQTGINQGNNNGKFLGEDLDLIYNFNDGVRNLGFAYVAKYLPDIKYIFSLDDDVLPVGDTIGDHLKALNQLVPISWMNTSMTEYMRGFPYNIREEAEVWVSHGVWLNVPDLDAITQLKTVIKPQEFYKGPIPKGILYPHCAMNFSFKREALPFIYQAPAFDNIQRFADIWGGIEMKKDLDILGKAVVTGQAFVFHTRASNVYKNLQKEARGIEMNDFYGQDPYFDLFFAKRSRWKRLMLDLIA